MRKLVCAYEDERADEMWYNMHTEEIGVESEPSTNEKRVNVIVMCEAPYGTYWHKCVCVNMWSVFKSARMFIREYMQPIYDACITLDMRNGAARVLQFARDMCADEGEGFNGEMLDTLVACGAKTDTVSVAVYNAVREWLSELM